MANKIVQLHDEANNNIYPVTPLDAIHGSGALRADFVLKAGDTMTGPLTAPRFIGNADSATKLQTARNIALTGDVTGNVNFNGTGNVSIATTNKHGLLHSNFTTQINTASGGWELIDSTYNKAGYFLKSIRTEASAPSWLLGNYSAGIAFGGGDTKGVISAAYSSPQIKFAGGNGMTPVWNFQLNATSGQTYTLPTTGGTIALTSSNITGNAATATKLATARTISLTGDCSGSASFNGSANASISVTVADDSHNHTGLKSVSFTGGNSNTPGWRLIGSWTVSAWMNNRANFIINSRHTGNGLLSIAYGCNSNTIDNTTVYCDIVISGNTHSKAGSIWNSNAFKGYFNSTNSKLYLFWYYTDYNSTDLIYFGSPVSDFTPAESTWVETIDEATYGIQVSTLRRSWNEGDSVTGAVWNDYAECRESDCEEFGYVLMENGDDTLTKTTERLSHFAGVSSDTWGFSQGETARARTPIAVAGRVLVYPYQDRNNYKPGDCVCAAPNGTVDIMTREEVINYPDRIVGTVSCVPDYEEWGGGENADRPSVKVNNRIWIKVK